MKEYKPLLAVFFAILVMIFLFSQYRGCTEFVKVPPSEIDSLTAVYDEKIMQKDVQLTALQWEIRDLNMARKWDSVLLHKQDKALTGSNKKLKEVIEAYEAVRTLENCDTVIVYAEDLSDKVDSLQSLLPHYQQTIDELVQVYDEALNAANDKALTASQFASQMRSIAITAESDKNKLIIKSKKQRTLLIIAGAVVAGALIIK